MGLIFLAAITELPKLVTTSAAVVSGNAALALTHIFGGITMQAIDLPEAKEKAACLQHRARSLIVLIV